MFDRVQRGYDTGYTQPEIQAGTPLHAEARLEEDMRDEDAQAAIDARQERRQGRHRRLLLGRLRRLAWPRPSMRGLAARGAVLRRRHAEFNDEKPKVPVMAHFGEQRRQIPVDRRKELPAKHPEAQVSFYAGAGHGFNCDQRGSYNAPPPSSRASAP